MIYAALVAPVEEVVGQRSMFGRCMMMQLSYRWTPQTRDSVICYSEGTC